MLYPTELRGQTSEFTIVEQSGQATKVSDLKQDRSAPPASLNRSQTHRLAKGVGGLLKEPAKPRVVGRPENDLLNCDPNRDHSPRGGDIHGSGKRRTLGVKRQLGGQL